MSTASGSIFAEYLPKLSVVSLYITISDLYTNHIRISVIDDHIIVPALNQLKFHFNDISLESDKNKEPLSHEGNTFYFRLIAKPPIESSGSSTQEIMPHIVDLQDQGLMNMLKYSSNSLILPEGVELNVVCRSCSNSLGKNIVFSKIRPLPADNWAERANDMWFCHPPDSQCHEKSSEISETLENMKLSEPVVKRSLFDILKLPDPEACYYSPTYWAINPCNLNGYKINYFKDSDIENKVVCDQCHKELGIRFSEGCIHLWDFGVEWLGLVDVNKPNTTISREYHLRVVENFKRAVFASIYEWTYSPTCQFIVKSHSPIASAFLWNLDRNLSVYRTNFEVTSEIPDICINSEKMAKFMYGEILNGKSVTYNPFEQKLISEAEKDTSQVLVLPDTVYDLGMKHLKDSSTLYFKTENSFKSAFLSYKLVENNVNVV